MGDEVYEMLWDCEYCGTKKLLGKTHRHCPACGAQQNPAKRYFPPEQEKVAVQDHVYYGADLVCPACKAASSARVKFCGNCGSPLEGAARAGLVGEKAPAPAPAAAPTAAKKGSSKKLLVGCGAAGGVVALGVLVFVLVAVLWKKPADLAVAGHSWSRTIQVEKFGPAKEKRWCGEMPPGAYDVTRTREVREHRKVQDGQDCKTVKKDRGDGTFVETQECAPRYRDEPVYDEKCSYSVNRWNETWSEKAQGAGLEPPPAWPAVNLARTGQGDCLGCEREGKRTEAYTVRFAGKEKEHACTFDSVDRWRAFPAGSKWSGKLRVLTGGLDCDSLVPAK